MSTIVTRAGKGSALTFAEVDANFTNLNTDKYQAGDTASLTALTLSTALTATSGGTGQASYTTGDLLYAASSTSLAKLADVATGNALISGGVGVAPAWGKIGLTTHVTGTLPVANGGTGITSFGAGVATWLGTPTSANLAAAVTDETGTGALVFANTPTLVTPLLGTPTSGTLTNCTGLPISTGVAGLGTGVATFLATPTSANLAAAVTDETGSGALVFGTSPTISGATLGGTVTLSGGTANGVVYLNGSQAATTGTALTFNGTNLGVNIASPTLNFEVGGNNATAYLHSGVSVMSFGTKNNYPIAFDTNNTERMRLDTSGNLGIGTNAPGQRLTVQSASGDVTKFQSTNASGGYITVGSTTTSPLLMGYGSTLNSGATISDAVLRANGGAWWIGTQTSNPIVLYTNGTEKARLNDVGELCVATQTSAFSNPNRGNITIGGTTSVLSFRTGGVEAGYFYHDGTNALLGNQLNGYLSFLTNTAERMRIQNNGFVGIGTTAPTVSNATATLLHLHQSAASTPSVTHYTNGTTGAAAADGLLTGLWVDNNALFFLYENSDIIFATNATERVRISAAGNVGIGTIAPADGLLHLNGGATTNIKFTNSTTGYTTSDGFYVGLGPSSDATAYVYQRENNPMVFATNNLERMRLSAAGNIGMGTASPQCLLHVAGQLNAVTQPTLGSYANSHFVVTQQAGLYGLNVGVSGNGDTWMQTQRFDSATAYNLQLNPMGGDVRIGETTPANLKVGGTANRATTVGTNHIDIFNGTAPAGTLANGISLYSAAGEAYVMDAAGNATLFSPHDSVTNEWIFRSKHTPTGRVLRIDVEKMLRFINDHFGLDMIQEFTEE